MRRSIQTSCAYAAIALLATHAALLTWGAWRHSPTVDEVAHLPAGISHWHFGRFDLYRVNPPLVRMIAALPVMAAGAKTDFGDYVEHSTSRSEFQVGGKFCTINGQRTFWLFTIARWACIPLSVVGALVCYAWARELYGPWPGMLALVLWCFCPTILGHAQLITPDAPAAALGVLAGYTFWRWLKAPSWTTALWAGVALGLCELTKSTWIVLFGLWPALWIVWRIGDWWQSKSGKRKAANNEPEALATDGKVKSQESRVKSRTAEP
jgi:4-amino-4-deoxy-L-arabinose transferase-like glycosyltransferase